MAVSSSGNGPMINSYDGMADDAPVVSSDPLRGAGDVYGRGGSKGLSLEQINTKRVIIKGKGRVSQQYIDSVLVVSFVWNSGLVENYWYDGANDSYIKS